jgi:hypothetical protein
MKQILQEYINALREIKSLEEKKQQLVKQLLHTKLSDGREIADIILNDRVYVGELIMDNFPDDASDREFYMESHSICGNLYFMKRDEDRDAEQTRWDRLHPSKPRTPWGQLSDEQKHEIELKEALACNRNLRDFGY